MVGGNALGDGKPKNDTKDASQETFADKYRKELKKDIDDLGADEEENEDLDSILGEAESTDEPT